MKTNYNYHQRRLILQLASLPCKWWVTLDPDDVEIAETLGDLLEKNGLSTYRATDLAREYKKNFNNCSSYSGPNADA